MGLFGSLFKGITSGGNIYAVVQNSVTAECILMDMAREEKSELFRTVVDSTIRASGGRMKPESVLEYFNRKNRLEQLCMIAIALDEDGKWTTSYPSFNSIGNPFLYTHKVTDTEINMATSNMERVTGRYIDIRKPPFNWLQDFSPVDNDS